MLLFSAMCLSFFMGGAGVTFLYDLFLVLVAAAVAVVIVVSRLLFEVAVSSPSVVVEVWGC